MASINAVLTAENGDDLYPETYDDYILDSNGEALSTRLGSRSEASDVSGTSAFAKINTLSSELTEYSVTLSNAGTDSAGTLALISDGAHAIRAITALIPTNYSTYAFSAPFYINNVGWYVYVYNLSGAYPAPAKATYIGALTFKYIKY